jgi:hypothetical protein
LTIEGGGVGLLLCAGSIIPLSTLVGTRILESARCRLQACWFRLRVSINALQSRRLRTYTGSCRWLSSSASVAGHAVSMRVREDEKKDRGWTAALQRIKAVLHCTALMLWYLRCVSACLRSSPARLSPHELRLESPALYPDRDGSHHSSGVAAELRQPSGLQVAARTSTRIQFGERHLLSNVNVSCELSPSN